jgi:basic membrane protein A
MSLSRRRFLIVMPAAAATLVAACAGDEDGGGRRSAGSNTPVVVQNATPLALSSPNPAAIAATAAAQAAGLGQGGASAPTGGQGAAKPGAAAGTPVPAGQAPAKAEPKAEAKVETKPGTRLGIVQPAWETIRLREQELNGQVRAVNTADPEDYQRNIDQLVRGGSTVVVTVGVDLAQVTQDAAEKNPSLKFVGVDQYQDRVLPNVVGLVFDDDKAGFLAGALAGLVTKSNQVGAIVGPGWMSTMVNLGEGFAAGAEYVNPNVDVFLEYHPGELPEGLADAKWGTETTAQMVQDGADVIFAAGGKTGQAALEVARQKGVPAIGAEVDQYDALPSVRSVLLTSVIKIVSTQQVQQLVKGVSDGSVKGGNVFGDIQIAPFREAEAKIPKTVRDRLQTIERGLKQGSVKTGVQTR